MVCNSFFSTVKEDFQCCVSCHILQYSLLTKLVSSLLENTPEVVLILNWRNVWNCAAKTRYCNFWKTSTSGSNGTSELGSSGTHSIQICIHISDTHMQACLKLCLFWSEELTPGLGMRFYSRWPPRGQLGHMVWGRTGSTGTHDPSDMQICSHRQADISNAYIRTHADMQIWINLLRLQNVLFDLACPSWTHIVSQLTHDGVNWDTFFENFQMTFLVR